MYKSTTYDEPLLNELGDKSEGKPLNLLPPSLQRKRTNLLPPSLQRKRTINIPTLDETQIVRHFFRLSQMNYGIDTGMYPLGSCTMKYNPKICDEISSWDCFSMTHPYQDESTVQGNLQMMYELEQMFCEISGMDSFTLQPAAGSQGEFTGLLLARAYHKSNKDFDRNEIILPSTSHGTNPASVTMSGYKIIEILSTKDGTVDLEALQKTLSDKTVCFMLTNPNTLGIFESDILEISRMVHEAGALLYYDGANMNAIMGKARPGDMGFDIVHLNLHKTFSTPHGGGGPGSGPIGVKKKLERFLPVPRIVKHKDKYGFDYDVSQSIGKIKAHYGNFSVLLKAYIYILLMGSDGLKESSEIAVLNAALDVAKRLLDYGLHPPTIYFPLIVKEALMIEPTESESKKTLDEYIDVLIRIADEDPKIVKNAPNNTAVKRVDDPNNTAIKRVDEAGAIKNQILTWKSV